jgi:hypothetical protein
MDVRETVTTTTSTSPKKLVFYCPAWVPAAQYDDQQQDDDELEMFADEFPWFGVLHDRFDPLDGARHVAVACFDRYDTLTVIHIRDNDYDGSGKVINDVTVLLTVNFGMRPTSIFSIDGVVCAVNLSLGDYIYCDITCWQILVTKDVPTSKVVSLAMEKSFYVALERLDNNGDAFARFRDTAPSDVRYVVLPYTVDPFNFDDRYDRLVICGVNVSSGKPYLIHAMPRYFLNDICAKLPQQSNTLILATSDDGEEQDDAPGYYSITAKIRVFDLLNACTTTLNTNGQATPKFEIDIGKWPPFAERAIFGSRQLFDYKMVGSPLEGDAQMRFALRQLYHPPPADKSYHDDIERHIRCNFYDRSHKGQPQTEVASVAGFSIPFVFDVPGVVFMAVLQYGEGRQDDSERMVLSVLKIKHVRLT